MVRGSSTWRRFDIIMQGSASLQGEVGLSDFNFRATTLERKTFFHRVVAYVQSNVRVKICHSTGRFLALFSLFVAVFSQRSLPYGFYKFKR